jgi:hypothetical protein
MITTGTRTAVRVLPQDVPVAPGAGADEQPAAATPSTATAISATGAATGTRPFPCPGDLVSLCRAGRREPASLIVTVAPFRDRRLRASATHLDCHPSGCVPRSRFAGCAAAGLAWRGQCGAGTRPAS